MKKVCVIGGGISSLSAAVYLVKNGYDVTLYEKNNNVGGFLHSWKRQGVLIDGCLHWMLGTKEGTGINTIWKEIGGLDNVPIYQAESLYCVYYEGRKLEFYADINRFEKELKDNSQGDDEEINDLIKAIKILGIHEIPSEKPYELLKENEIPVDIRKMVRLKKYLSITLEELALRFHSPIISFALKEGVVFCKHSAFYFLQTLSNFMNGNAALPYGGSLSLQERLKDKLLSLGGKINLNSPVDKIITEGNKVTGISVKGKCTGGFDYYVYGADIHYLNDKLLPGKLDMSAYFDKDKQKEKFSAYSFAIASYKCRAGIENCPVSQLYKTSPFTLFGREYNSISLRYYGYDPSFINEKGETCMQVMIPTEEKEYDYLSEMNKDTYKKEKEKTGKIILEKLKTLFKDVDFELIDVLTPLTYERYTNSYKGMFMTYPLAPKEPSLLHSFLVKGIDNLVLASQWLLMPGGTPVAVVNGKFAYQLVDYLDNK